MLHFNLFDPNISLHPESFIYSTATTFQQHIKQDLNLLDFTFYNQHKSKTNTSFFSFRIIWLEILQNIYADNIYLYTSSDNTHINKAKKIIKNKMWGIGPRMGLDSMYILYKKTAFLFNVSGSLLSTTNKYLFKTYISSVFDSDAKTLLTSFTQKKRFLIQPFLNAAFGLNYMTLFDNDNSQIDINLLYETNFLFYKNYNLYSYGVTFSIILTF